MVVTRSEQNATVFDFQVSEFGSSARNDWVARKERSPCGHRNAPRWATELSSWKKRMRDTKRPSMLRLCRFLR